MVTVVVVVIWLNFIDENILFEISFYSFELHEISKMWMWDEVNACVCHNDS